MAKSHRLKELIDCEVENLIGRFPSSRRRLANRSNDCKRSSATGFLNEPAIWKIALQIGVFAANPSH
jgi:hypothetical protein